MKKNKLTAACLAICMLLSSLCGCGETGNPVITFRNTVINENEYVYLISTYKGQLLSSYNLTVDDQSIWEAEMTDNLTIGDFYGALFADQIMTRAIWLQLFDEYKLTLTDEQKKSVADWVDEWIRYTGSKAQLNAALEVYNIDAKMLREIKLDELRANAVQEYLFGTGGIMQPTDEDIEKCYLDTYSRTKFIRLSKEKEYDFGSDGKPIYDEEKGVFSVHEMSEAEFAKKAALYVELQNELKNGADFEELMNKYTMESGMIYFEDGYYFNSQTAIMPDALKTQVSAIEIGEWIAVETETDWYIAKRYELTEKPYLKAEYLQTMFTTLAADTLEIKKSEFISGQNGDLKCSMDDLLATFPFAAMTPNFYIH